MDHFVDEDVFQTLMGFPGKLGIETNNPAICRAAPPTCFHTANNDLIDLHT
jgi:hypothetical protein